MSKIRITYKTIRPALKTSSSVTLSKEVVFIEYGKRSYVTSTSPSRRIFIDEKNQFWYLTGGHVYPEKYAYTQFNGSHYQAITISGSKLIFQANSKFELIETSSGKPDERPLPFALNAGYVYRLNNGFKMKIVALETDMDFVSEPTYIGVYRQNGTDSAIRFNAKGKVISHGGNIEYDIESEWALKDLWLVVGPNPNAYPVTYFSTPFPTEEAALKFVGTNKSLVITKVVV